MTLDKILRLLPYSKPFLFVDELEKVDEQCACGYYTFPEHSFFYQGHFKEYPVTPGVILTETMAQIGVVSLGIFLMADQLKNASDVKMALSSNQVDYYLPVYPGERVKVYSEKVYFRFGKLKCKVEMRNEENELVCRGSIAGMIQQEISPKKNKHAE